MICAIDETPLDDAGPPKPRVVRGVYLAVPKARKIPISLLIVSYLFLLPALPSIFYAGFMGWLIYEVGLTKRGSMTLLIIFSVTCASMIFWCFLFRGLRYCSRG
jgi:hypothetical protein